MSAHALLNLLNELGKYHMTLRLLEISFLPIICYITCLAGKYHDLSNKEIL